ncbi:Uncharacterised protein [Candidatus Tiddalikarchaeum anstoanum]|nr:Uncharacterised protein [Candidatus Tiddalikarchaeum anstoanum]
MNLEIVSEEYMTNAEVKKILTGKKDTTEQVEQGRAKEHVKDFSKLPVEKAVKLKKELADLSIGKLKPELIVLIINLLPKDVDELKLALSMSVMPFGDDEIQKIFECVKPYFK